MRIHRTITLVALLGAASPGCAGDGPPWFIPGTASLPECTEAAAYDLNGTYFADSGTVTIVTAGCAGATVGEVFPSCSLGWDFVQQGNDIQILVDHEYEIEGRLCGDQLYLRGGWWLPVEDEDLMQCTYDDDSAEEVGILDGGNVLTVHAQDMSDFLIAEGTLKVGGPCEATYAIELRQFM